jgi:hypothetical protein
MPACATLDDEQSAGLQNNHSPPAQSVGVDCAGARYGRPTCMQGGGLKINFREILTFVRFSSFATQSPQKRTSSRADIRRGDADSRVEVEGDAEVMRTPVMAYA